ncbi:zinc finger protein 862-like isoform X2 [Antennarius striatus]|uniref:zinc finger protein 862-like isoform X2 n=1 Tax=Antennarius striatus TaxID=241820 RepID=UPI0035AEE0A1
MCDVQTLRAFVLQRLAAAAEDIIEQFERTLANNEERRSERQKLLESVFSPQVHPQRAEVQMLFVTNDEVHPEQQDLWSNLEQDNPPEPPNIKEELEEVQTNQDTEQLPGLKEEAGVTELMFSSVPVMSEEDEEKPQSYRACTRSMKRRAKGKRQQTSLQSFFKATRPSHETGECIQETVEEQSRLESPHPESPATPGDCSAETETPAKKAKTSAAADSGKKQAMTQKERDRNRQIKADWFSIFKWLIYDKEKNLFFCTYCIEAKKTNLFTRGKCAKVPKKDDFNKHTMRADHKMAAGAKQGSRQMSKARAKADDRARESMTAAFETVQWMEDMPNVTFSGPVDLQLEDGAQSLRVLGKDDGSIHDSHQTSVNDLRECVATEEEEEILKEVDEARYFSLEADEATDGSNKTVLRVYIRYVGPDARPRVRFLGVREMRATTSDAITAALQQFLEAKGLNKDNMVGLATDGASVMTGVKVDLTTQFKKEVPFLVANHCMAHRLQQAAEKAATRVPLISKYIGTLNCFARVVQFSAKFTRTLEVSRRIHSGQTKKIKEAFLTRVLSLCDGTQAMAGCVPAVLSALEQAATEKSTAEGKAQLKGLAADMGSYKFIYLTHFLADTVGLLGILSKLMQVTTPTYQDLKDAIDNTVCSLLALVQVKGTGGFLEKLEGAFPATPPAGGKTLWEDHNVKDTQKQRDEVKKAVDLFMDNIVTQLQCTFPDHDTMSAFDIFCPSAKLTRDDSSDKLDKLLELYGADKEKKGVTHTKVVDPDAAKTEWKILGPMVPKYSSMEDLYCRYVSKNKDAYPNMERLVKIGVTITVTSVNCERGVSRSNAIKTSSRNGPPL